jgi:hypothetical protein
MFDIIRNIFIKELDDEIKNRVLNLCEDGDYGILPPPMNAQKALNELCDHLLGEDWYVVNPISTEQANTEIVYAIERKYKRVK